LLAFAVSAQPKNIILLIGDGMGPAHIKAYRQFINQGNNQPTVFDQYLIGTLATDPEMETGNVTDSAASATAYSTGSKSYNGAIGVDVNKQPLKTVLQLAKEKGKATGLVVTSQVVHATPAAFAAHIDSRRKYNEIADQYIDNRFNNLPYIDVILGGGTKYFAREDRNLLQEFASTGYEVVSNVEQLVKSDSQHLLGLFAPVGLPSVLERDDTVHPSLAQMTQKALSVLQKNEKGFFLMVEGSQIDWASHDNDIHGMLHEMDDFAKAFKTVVDFSKQRDDTIVLLTADHETGGLSLGRARDGKNHYLWKHELLRNLKISSYQLAELLFNGKVDEREQVLLQFFAVPMNQAQRQQLMEVTSADATHNWLKQFIDYHTYTGWTTGGHTGVDVYLYGLGDGIERFRGHHSNNYIGQQIMFMLSK